MAYLQDTKQFFQHVDKRTMCGQKWNEMDQWINIKIKWYWMKKTKNHRPLTIKPPGFPWFSPRVPLGSPAGHPSYTRRGGAKEMHQRKKATKTLMHLSPRLRLPQQSFGKLTPFLGPSKGWVSSQEYIQHTHGKWPHITGYHKFHMNKLQKAGWRISGPRHSVRTDDCSGPQLLKIFTSVLRRLHEFILVARHYMLS